MKKNVLFVIDSLTCGGAEKSLVSLLPLLNRDKYDLYLWIRSRGGVFESLLPSDVIIVEPPEYSFKEKLLKIIAQIGFSICIRWNHLTRKKVHGAELLWQCMGKTIKVPDGHWDAVVAYQQGIPTYLVASHFDGSKKLAWVNVDISSAGYNSKFNTKFYSKYNNIIAVSDSLKCMLDEAMSQFREKYDVEVVKMALLQNSYHTDINITDKLFTDTEKHLYEFYSVLKLAKAKFGDFAGKDQKVEEDFDSAMRDDLNTSKALSYLYSIFKTAREKVEKGDKSVVATLNSVVKTYSLLGIFKEDAETFVANIEKKTALSIPNNVKELAEKRWQAKKERNFALADQLRKEIEELGYLVLDAKDGYKITK